VAKNVDNNRQMSLRIQSTTVLAVTFDDAIKKLL